MWWNKVSNDSDVVVSTRVRFARNIDGYMFPNIISKSESKNLLENIKNVLDTKEYKFFSLNSIDENTRFSLVEQHLISKEFLNDNDFDSKAVILNNDNNIVVMVNEEDHLRMQSFESGLNIESCYDKLEKLSDELGKKLNYAISEKYGYLTSCPTNVGSGLRVSVMLHLPALARLGILTKILDDVSNIGVSVRGLYGENTSAHGNMYQISNQKTLGQSDIQTINKLRVVINSIVDQERKARKVLLENSIELEDELFRTYGVLKNARLMSSEEALKLLAKLRMAVAIGLITQVSLEKVQSLIIEIQSSTFKTIIKKDMDEKEENINRAKYLRKEID